MPAKRKEKEKKITSKKVQATCTRPEQKAQINLAPTMATKL